MADDGNVSIDLEGKIRVLHQLARTFGSRVCNKTFIKETNIGILHLHMDTVTGLSYQVKIGRTKRLEIVPHNKEDLAIFTKK